MEKHKGYQKMVENKRCKTICAIIVTFNRKELLLHCLDSIINQTIPVDGIYIVDNASNDGTPQSLYDKGYIPYFDIANIGESVELETEIKQKNHNKILKIFYFRTNKNLGGAGGFYEGLKKGYEKGFDWLWIMDDDAEPKEDALENLIPYMSDCRVVLSNLKMGIDGVPEYNHVGFFEGKFGLKLIREIKPKEINKNSEIKVDFSSFVGLLIPSDLISVIGLPKSELFLYFDDFEYCYRIRKVSQILLITNSIVYHKDHRRNKYTKKKLLFESCRYEYDDFWRMYYGIRNFIYIKKALHGKVLSIISALFLLIKIAVGILVFNDDNKAIRLSIIIKAIVDGLKGSLGYKSKSEIYKNIFIR